VVVGVLVVSVSLAFLFASNDFAFGGSVGTMISNWLITMIGTIGTAALLLVAFLAYVIWQFNPVFRLPRKSQTADKIARPGEQEIIAAGKTVNDLYAEAKKGNSLKGDAKLFIATDESNGMQSANDLKIIEKDEEEANEAFEDPVVTKEVVADIMHQHDLSSDNSITGPAKIKRREKLPEELELEIKTSGEADTKTETEPKEKTYQDLPPYEPTLDLRDYKYPRLDLLETHGSERIVQDPAELEENKTKSLIHLKTMIF